jgi:hypothetical protein
MSNKKAWELVVLSTTYFPPTRDLENWLQVYLEEHFKIENEEKIYASYCLKKLAAICKTGPKGRVPTTREIERHIVILFTYPSPPPLNSQSCITITIIMYIICNVNNNNLVMNTLGGAI